jgi:hypothetical protein
MPNHNFDFYSTNFEREECYKSSLIKSKKLNEPVQFFIANIPCSEEKNCRDKLDIFVLPDGSTRYVKNHIHSQKLVTEYLDKIILSKKQIESFNYKLINNKIDLYRDKSKLWRSKLLILVSGYNDDKREIFQIPEIRQYFKKLFVNHPEILYYLSNYNSTRNFIFDCIYDINHVKYENGQLMVSGSLDEDIGMTVLKGLKEFGDKIGDKDVLNVLTTF